MPEPLKQPVPQAAPAPAVMSPPAPAPQPGANPPLAPPGPSGDIGSPLLGRVGVTPALQDAYNRARGVSEATRTAAIGALGESQQQREAITERMEGLPDLEPPKLEQMGPAPTQEPTNPLRVFAQILPVVAMLGGTQIRNNASAALRAGAAAMRAARENDAEALERAHQEWTSNLQALTQRNSARLDEWNAILSDRNLAMDEMVAQLNALAARDGNTVQSAQLASGQVTELAQGVQIEMQAQNQLMQQFLQQQQINAQREAALAGTRGSQLASAEQRGRLVLSYPNIVNAQRQMREMERAASVSDENQTPFGRDWGARMLEAVPFDGGTLARVAGGDDYTNYEQASRTFEQSMMPIFSGSAVTESEAQRFVRANLPRLGDSPAILAEKAANRDRMTNSAAVMLGAEPPFPDAGYWSPSTGLQLPTGQVIQPTEGQGGNPQATPGNYTWTPENGLRRDGP